MDGEKIAVIDEEGKELEFDILFTFNDENTKKDYVLYYDAEAENPMVYASIYDEEGNLFEIEDSKEWDMINEVFESFMASEDEELSDDETEIEDLGCCEGDDDECF